MDIMSENRRRLLNSLEMRCLARNIVIFLIMAPIFLLASRVNTAKWAVVAILLLSFLAFYLVRVVNILRKPEAYRFYRTMLTQPRRKYLTKSWYFTVTLEENGIAFTRDTHAIFSAYDLAGPRADNYVNQTVTIAYNPETTMVVVIG